MTKAIKKEKDKKVINYEELTAEQKKTRRFVEIAKRMNVPVEQIELMHQTVAKGTNTEEFLLFLNIAQVQDLNPFTKEIWCYKDGKGNVITFASKDGFLKKAQSNPAYNGIRSSEICVEDQFTIDIANNKIVHNIADIANRGKIVGAYAIAFRKDGEPTIELVDMKTYDKSNPKYSTPWKTHPAEMIKKVAEVHALKKAFGISGVHAEEDFTIKDGMALPLQIEEVTTRKLTDQEFKQLLTQSDEYIGKFYDKLDFTKEQRTEIDRRLA